MDEPTLRVGLVVDVPQVDLVLEGPYRVWRGEVEVGPIPSLVQLTVCPGPEGARLLGPLGELVAAGRGLRLVPVDPDRCSFLLLRMTVGVQFHWEHHEDLRFRGGVALVEGDGGLTVVNEVPLEQYLVSVISSEMSAGCPGELLRAHAVISRSWLLAQLGPRAVAEPAQPEVDGRLIRLVRWYDREDHHDFDVCADDHCQRYQGITRARDSSAPADAVRATRGRALVHDGVVCDARFSKCCGGMTALFSSAWSDEDPAYLAAFPDSAGPAPFALPLTDEHHAVAYIEGRPPVWCNTDDDKLLARILPDIDHGTRDFFRWEVALSPDEVRELVRDKSGYDLGPVRAIEALDRGPSGRIVHLRIEGGERTLEVGKELEIRRLLSPTHLYSSAFAVRRDDGGRFVLRGAGWGHGVGLCQIGAAVMADQGHAHPAILAHYYPGATLSRLYT